MSSKDYRELQLSSSQLVVIFLAIIILGVIFVFVVLFMPNGIVGLWHQAKAYFIKAPEDSTPEASSEKPV